MTINAIKAFFILIIVGQCATASAHKYFFGLTELSVNPKTQNIEIIHQFTAHDLENTIAEQTQEAFSPQHSKYELYIQEYVNNHFQIFINDKKIPLVWVGFEYNNDKIIMYQEAQFENNLLGLVVKNDLLVDTYDKQVNTLNYQDAEVTGSLTFTRSNNVATIKNNN